MHPAFTVEEYQISRGKNWCDDETRILIDILEDHFPNLLRKLRKGSELEVVSRKLKARGILRSRKEVQNKYKSLLAEYRNEVTNLRKNPTHKTKFKWFSRFDAIMKSQTAKMSSGGSCSAINSDTQPQIREETVIKRVVSYEESEGVQELEKNLEPNLKFLMDSLNNDRNALSLIKSNITCTLEELTSRLEQLDSTLSLISRIIYQLMSHNRFTSEENNNSAHQNLSPR